jgi:hypothetical protein
MDAQIVQGNYCLSTIRRKLHLPIHPESCSNSPLDFSNNTIFYGPDSVLTYQWNMDDEDLLYEVSPSYTFATGGDKNITLSASIPGCSSETSDLISITPGPLTSFGFDGSCEYDQFRVYQLNNRRRHHRLSMGLRGWLLHPPWLLQLISTNRAARMR